MDLVAILGDGPDADGRCGEGGGVMRPCAIGFAGNYPKAMDGLARILSLDMLRGYALVCIMLNHMPLGVLRQLTLTNFAIYDAARNHANAQVRKRLHAFVQRIQSEGEADLNAPWLGQVVGQMQAAGVLRPGRAGEIMSGADEGG